MPDEPHPEHLDRTRGLFRDHGFTILLITMVIYLSSLPLLHALSELTHPMVDNVVSLGTFWLILLAAAAAIARSRATRIVVWTLALAAIVTETAGEITASHSVALAGLVIWIVYLSFVVALTLRRLFESRKVTFNVINASLAVYIALGLIWTGLYTLAEQVRPGSFTQPLGLAVGDFERSLATVYYSFVTLTTLGYGDISPVTPLARTLSIVQALVGQLYLVVMVARFVGLHTAQTIES